MASLTGAGGHGHFLFVPPSFLPFHSWGMRARAQLVAGDELGQVSSLAGAGGMVTSFLFDLLFILPSLPIVERIPLHFRQGSRLVGYFHVG